MSQFSALDAQHMAKAIRLAAKGQFTTTPNPNVGCVLADPKGKVVGEGWHQKAGSGHAEVHALNQAGANAKGATAYVSLEPCSHTGLTPPCADALIKAGVVRVIAAMEDPNPLVAGRGLAKLAAAGIDVSHGLLQKDAEALNQGFIKRMSRALPWVTVKLASSLDGKTALANGQSQWITSPQARQDVQRHRAKTCGILSGSGTVLADDPSLNVRYHGSGLSPEVLAEKDLRQPLRIILDGRNQLHCRLKLFRLPGEVLVINSRHNAQLISQDPLTPITQWQAPYDNNQLQLQSVFQYLGTLQLNNIWVEAGGKLAGALLQNALIDEVILYQAPKLLGDQGQDLFVIDERTSMQQAYLLQWQDIRQVGCDLKLRARVQYPEP